MASYSTWKTDLETAISAVTSGLSSGEATVEYEIRGRRHKVKPSDELLINLLNAYDRICAKSNRQSKGWLRVARLSRPSGIGAS